MSFVEKGKRENSLLDFACRQADLHPDLLSPVLHSLACTSLHSLQGEGTNVIMQRVRKGEAIIGASKLLLPPNYITDLSVQPTAHP